MEIKIYKIILKNYTDQLIVMFNINLQDLGKDDNVCATVVYKRQLSFFNLIILLNNYCGLLWKKAQVPWKVLSPFQITFFLIHTTYIRTYHSIHIVYTHTYTQNNTFIGIRLGLGCHSCHSLNNYIMFLVQLGFQLHSCYNKRNIVFVGRYVYLS